MRGLPEDGIDDDSMEHVAANAGEVVVDADAVHADHSLPDELHLNLQAVPGSFVPAHRLMLPI